MAGPLWLGKQWCPGVRNGRDDSKYGLHGRIGNKPAHHVELSVDGEAGTIRIVGIVDETRFHFFKLRMTTTIEARVGESTIAIRDTISNLSASRRRSPDAVSH